MAKLKFDRSLVLKEIRKTFPKAKISKYKELTGGLINAVYSVKINFPHKMLAAKIYRPKNRKMVSAGMNASIYLHERGFPIPKIYSNKVFHEKGILIMDFIEGKEGARFYEKSSEHMKRKILINSGRLLRRIHSLKIPKIWVHHHHEVKNSKEWKKWTELRARKYLQFANDNLDEKYCSFLEKEFNELLPLIDNQIKLVPMHWDYHLSNLIFSKEGEINGIFDFDNALKGDALADLAQSRYWMKFRFNDKHFQHFKYILKGYGLSLSKKQKKIIRGYMILHMAAVTRTIWDRRERLGWIIEKHKKIWDELMEDNL